MNDPRHTRTRRARRAATGSAVAALTLGAGLVTALTATDDPGPVVRAAGANADATTPRCASGASRTSPFPTCP